MVTKPFLLSPEVKTGSVLAKIHMVTKLPNSCNKSKQCSVLAKILTVTKQSNLVRMMNFCSVLAKILMVTKPQKYGSTFLNVIEY